MTLKSRLRACVLLLSVASLPLASASLNTARIIASAAAPDCISWRVSGICYWLYCSASGCMRIPLYSITDWHRSPISDSHPFDQPGT